MRKIEPWRILIGVIAVAYIIFMWARKDIFTIYSTMPKEQAILLVITTLAVSLVKVAALTGAILLIRWIIGKIKTK